MSMQSATSRQGFWNRFWRHSYKKSLLPLLLIVVTVSVIEGFGWFQHMEATALDSFTRGGKQAVSTKILLVEITDEDYKDLFDNQSPLEPSTVLQLIDAIRLYHPKAIGIDLDTQDASWRAVKVDPKKYPEVVWAEVPEESVEGEEPKLHFSPVLGGLLLNPLQMGVVRFPQDADGVIRRYRTHYDVSGAIPDCTPPKSCDGTNSKAEQVPEKLGMDAFFRVMARRYDPRAKLGDNAETLFRFSGDRDSFRILRAKEFLRKADGGEMVVRAPAQDSSAIVSNSIVLLGGNFAAGRDDYMTPLGKMSGVELLANAVESDLAGGIRQAGFIPLKLLDLVMGSLIVFIYFVFEGRPRTALAVSIASILLFPTLAGAIAYFGAASWLNFAPVMLGMLIHQMYEGTDQLCELRNESKKQLAEISQLKSDLAKAKENQPETAQQTDENSHAPRQPLGAAPPLSKKQASGA